MLTKHSGAHDRAHAHDSLDETRHRFGGLDLPAAVAGALAATGLAALLGAAAVVVEAVRHDQGADEGDLWVAGGITALAVLVVALIMGGWVAGRIARYDGIRNGWLSGVLFAILVGAVGGIGRWADDRWHLLKDVQAPSWLSSPSNSAEIGVALVGIGAVLLAGGLAGALGARYHRRADSLLVTAPPALVEGDADVALERSDRAGHNAVR